MPKVTSPVAAAVAGAIVCAAPVEALPPQPVPFIEHDGTYRVDVDIRPGLYLTPGAAGSAVCSWLRLSSAGGREAPNVIEHGESSGAQYALVAPTDAAFETHGCGTWSIGSRAATPIAPPGRTCIYPLTGCVDPQDP
jgi:hypothetical protein